MVKTIKIGERDVRFDTSLSWMFKYRTQFGHDPIDVIMPAVKAAIPLVEIEGGKLTIADLDLLTDILGELNFTEALQLIWAVAANGNKDIDDPETWYSQFEFFPLDEVLTDVAPALFESCISSKKFKALSQKFKKAVPKEISASKESSRED